MIKNKDERDVLKYMKIMGKILKIMFMGIKYNV